MLKLGAFSGVSLAWLALGCNNVGASPPAPPPCELECQDQVAMRALREATWPGNVRELQHYIERTVVTTAGPTIRCENLTLPPPLADDEDLRSVTRGAVGQAERSSILAALEKARGNRSQAARLLKISRAGLYNKLRAYCIQ